MGNWSKKSSIKLLSSGFRIFLFLTFLITLWWGAFFVLPDFLIYPTSGFSGIIYTFFHWAFICVSVFFIVYILLLNRYVFALVVPVLTLLGSIIGFYSYSYKATLTPMIVDATLNNDIGTSLDVISPQLIIFIFFNFALSFFVVRYRWQKIAIQKPFYHLMGAVVAFILLLSVNGRATNSFMQHFPLSLYYNFNEYQKLNTQKNLIRVNPDPTVKSLCDDSITVVLVIGESLRFDHLSLNGYKRETMPLLSKRKNLVSLPNIYSEYTYTNPSVAHMLTRADSIYPDRAKTEKSFVSLFKASGYHTTWIANQDAADDYYFFMTECDTLMYAHPEKSVYTYSDWFDEDLLPHFSKAFASQKSCQLIILHSIGSHWYYNSHVPEKFNRFLPITDSKIITQNTKEQIINSYDNTVLYTDWFLDNVIKQIENKKSILIYLSDHGELLGENGLWLHASENEILHRPAALVWFSSEYLSNYPLKYENLLRNKDRRFRTDFLFHSILTAGGISTNIKQADLDIFQYLKR